jgi:hypothetical protein
MVKSLATGMFSNGFGREVSIDGGSSSFCPALAPPSQIKKNVFKIWFIL